MTVYVKPHEEIKKILTWGEHDWVDEMREYCATYIKAHKEPDGGTLFYRQHSHWGVLFRWHHELVIVCADYTKVFNSL